MASRLEVQAARADQVLLSEHPQLVRHARFRNTDHVRQITNAQWPASQRVQDARPRRVCQGAEGIDHTIENVRVRDPVAGRRDGRGVDRGWNDPSTFFRDHVDQIVSLGAPFRISALLVSLVHVGVQEAFASPYIAQQNIVSTRLLDRFADRARALKRETIALYLAARDPRTPWYARLLAAAIVAYALSPLDLIPDFVPVLGYLDDLIIVPLGIAVVLRMVPAEVLADCRARADVRTSRPVSRVGAVIVVAVWLVAAAWLILAIHGLFV